MIEKSWIQIKSQGRKYWWEVYGSERGGKGEDGMSIGV